MSERPGGDPAHRAIVAEHRHLTSLFAETRTALEKPGDNATARAALARLRDGMEAHFQREESLYYPTIWALRPDLKGSLESLVETHPQFRERLETISGALVTASLTDACQHLDEFADLFNEHERAEELLLQSLAVELTGTA